jgi:3-oxosteroid 1-dehydrogenase
MDEAWWMPSSVQPDGAPHMHLLERSKPNSLIVDSTGRRFVNECVSYMEFGQAMHRRQAEGGPGLRFWLLLDGRNRRRYPFGLLPPGFTPRRLIRQGYLRRAATLEALADSCAIDPCALRETVRHFNDMCTAGRDTEFSRGEDAYDRYYGDPRVTPNLCLGRLDRAPFFAVELFCGDIGTCGGVVTDEHARVLRSDLMPIPHLYATGNCTASVMGRSYPGPGATIGPAALFGYRAACHMGDGVAAVADDAVP